MLNLAKPQIDDRPLAIIGGGFAGRRIACTWVAAGFNVQLFDTDNDQRSRAETYVADNALTYLNRVDKIPLGSLKTFDRIESVLTNAWMIIESIPELLSTKLNLFGELDRLAPDDCILCTNSTSFKSSQLLQKVVRGRNRMLNTHYMMLPCNRLVELMSNGETNENVIDLVEVQLRKAGLQPIRAQKESTGFVMSRIWSAFQRECHNVLSEGISTCDDLDKACLEMFNLNGTGPYRQMDRNGFGLLKLTEDDRDDDSWSDAVESFDDNSDSDKSLSNQDEDPSLFFLDLGIAAMPQNAFNAGRVIAGSANGSTWNVLADHEILPDGISVSRRSQKLFWTQMGTPGKFDGCIRSSNLDGSNITTIVGNGQINTAKQLITYDDGDKEQLYFCDREGMKIYRCNIDGSGLEVLIDTGDVSTQMTDPRRHCVGIAVSKSQQKVYWTQKGPSKGQKGRILRADLESPPDVKSRTDIEVILDGLPEPVDLDIDDDSGCLYWTDRGELPSGNSLCKINLSCMDTDQNPAIRLRHARFVARNLHEAIGLALDVRKRHVYVTDLGGSVYRFDMDSDSASQTNMRVVYQRQGQAAFSGIALMH